jgi:hypothetical protein
MDQRGQGRDQVDAVVVPFLRRQRCCARARRSSTSATFAAQPFDQKLIRCSFVSLAARHQSLIGPPSHAIRFCNIIANPAVRAQTAAKLECLSQRPIPPALALGAVAEPMRPPGCERDRAVRKMELCGELPSSRAHPPPSVAAEGLLCRCEFEPIVGFALLSGPMIHRHVLKPHTAPGLPEFRFESDRGNRFSGSRIAPSD